MITFHYFQYENQISILGSWTNKGPLMSRPKFSDSQGKVSLPKEKFEPPPGWAWEGDWYISPELRYVYIHSNFSSPQMMRRIRNNFFHITQ